jgi:pyruvate dehydrogenase (quinone)
MSRTVSDSLVERLALWGVRRVFGYPGDGINGLMGALRRAEGAVEFVQARHEEMAAFMACAHAKFTGEVGVCLATSGPGAIHLLNGLYDAKLDHQPVLAVVGQAARSGMGSDLQQEVDLQTLLKDVAGDFVQTAAVPEQVPHLLDRAMRIARARRAVVALVFPKDLQGLAAADRPVRERSGESRTPGASPAGVGHVSPLVVPREEDLARAAAALNAGKRVAMLVGAGALDATDETVAVAERLGAGVAEALLGKAAVPDDLPFVTGTIGLLGTRPSWDLMQGCDTLLMVGSRFPWAEFLPEPGTVRGVQVDLDAGALSLRYPMEVGLVGDAGPTLRALLPLLEPKADLSWRERVEKGVSDWWKVLEARAHGKARPLNPQRVFWELSPRLPEGAILTGDAGTAAIWMARDLRLRRGMSMSLSGGLASMGSGVPYAVAAKLAFPGRPVIAACGDGAMQMAGNAELLTIAKYRDRFEDPRLVVVVLNNGDLNMVTWEQRAFEGDPKFPASQDLPDFPYARYAESIGLEGIRVESPGDVGPAWDRALSADRPVVLEAVVDPDVPPLPPHLDFKEASAYVAAMLKGDPDVAGVIRQSWRELAAPLFR